MVGMDVQSQSSDMVEMAMHIGRTQVEHTGPMVDTTVGHCLMVLVTVGGAVNALPLILHCDVEVAQR